nr:unnamed protein product [Digitaria exilis]
METSGGDGEVSGKRAKPSSDNAGGGEEDRVSALPDDVLVLILRRLLTPEAARTSALSRRWRRVWTLLPELRFLYTQDCRQIRAALEAHEASLRCLFVGIRDAAPDSVAAWLPAAAAAARRISGQLVFHNIERGNDAQEEAEERGAFALPCLERATTASLHLGLLGLAVPPAGVFARLTELSLTRVRIHGPGKLGDAVSSPWCPCLRKLTVSDAWGLDNLVIHSDSLRQVKLEDLHGLRQLTIVASALKDLDVTRCFMNNRKQLVASISAPQLVTLVWDDLYDPSFVHLGEMEHLQSLWPFFFLVYGEDSLLHNHACLSLVRRFKTIQSLTLALHYFWEIDDFDYLMEDMTMLPDITFLKLVVSANGHALGASAFHVLRMCSGIRRLMLSFLAPTNVEVKLPFVYPVCLFISCLIMT